MKPQSVTTSRLANRILLAGTAITLLAASSLALTAPAPSQSHKGAHSNIILQHHHHATAPGSHGKSASHKQIILQHHHH